MKSSGLLQHEEKFRSAVRDNDLARLQAALQGYIACFRARARTVREIEDARRLFEWGIAAASSQRTQMAEELMLLRRMLEAYGTPNRFHTWRLEG
jgi:hypothetical protein